MVSEKKRQEKMERQEIISKNTIFTVEKDGESYWAIAKYRPVGKTDFVGYEEEFPTRREAQNFIKTHKKEIIEKFTAELERWADKIDMKKEGEKIVEGHCDGRVLYASRYRVLVHGVGVDDWHPCGVNRVYDVTDIVLAKKYLSA